MTIIRARASTELDSERITITDIIWTCDSCGDDVKKSYPLSKHVYIPESEHFHVEFDPKRYLVRCPVGHEEYYSSTEVYAAVNL